MKPARDHRSGTCRAVICGGRNYQPMGFEFDLLDRLARVFRIDAVISGTARGADAMGERWAESRGIPVERFEPDWSRGKRGGPERNARMAKVADLVIAFPGGDGTDSMKRIARARGVLVFEVDAASGSGVFVTQVSR